MQTSSANIITHRVELRGDDDIKARLKELGDVGEKEFKRVSDAAAAPSPILNKLSGAVSTVRTNFQAIRNDFQPFSTGIRELHARVGEFGERMTNMAERIIPNFREAIAIGAAGGVAGMVLFVKSGAEAASQIGKLSTSLGIGVVQFQALAAASKLSSEEFGKFMQKFAVAAEQAGDKQLASIVEGTKATIGNISMLPVTVFSGIDKAQKASSALIVRGNMEIGKSVSTMAAQFDVNIASSVRRMDELGKKIFEVAAVQRAAQRDSGIPVTDTLEQRAQQIANIAAQFDKTGEEMRQRIRDLGGANLIPALNSFEALDNLSANLEKKLERVVTMWKVVNGSLERKTVEEAFLETADAVSKMTSAMDRAALVRSAFGREGARMMPTLMKGKEGIHDLVAEFTKLGIAITPAETAIGKDFVGSFHHLETAISNVRTMLAIGLAPAVMPALEALTHAVGESSGKIREMGQSVGAYLAPSMTELAEVIIHGADAVEIHSQGVRTLVSLWEIGSSVFRLAAGGLNLLVGALDYVAEAINMVFGTHFTGTTILAIAAFGRLTGMVAGLEAGLGLAGKAIEIVWAGMNGLALMAIRFLPLLGVLGPTGLIIVGLLAIGAALITWQGSWEDVGKAVGAVLDWLLMKFDGIGKAIYYSIALLGRFLGMGGGAFGGGGGGAAVAPIPPEAGGKATGGPITGPGGTDRVPIWATAGEFMMRTAAVAKYGLGFMDAINSLSWPNAGPATPAPASLRYAGGGPVVSVAGAGGRIAVDLSINGETFGDLLAPPMVATKLVKFARSARLFSAGRKPGSFGAGRG